MNRIDNTHATFINCLRDWNDPFLHGHKPIKPFGCQRCESCACRSYSSNNTTLNHSLNSTSSTNTHHHHHDIDLNRHYLTDTHSKQNRNILNNRAIDFQGFSSNTPFQPIVRCKSSANVPKTIDQCLTLVKSRPRPSSIKSNASRKSSIESIPSKKQSKTQKNRYESSKISTNSIESDKESNDTISKEDDCKNIFQSISSDSSLSQNLLFPKGLIVR